ncbi:MAG TPA: ROK family protein [Pyrinomonadaceae bacterium]|jgi:glucokinase|nr:ROK family protein [Pyrinomonadaceae bacterium]
MPDKSTPNYAGIEIALTTLRGVLISATGETIEARTSSYEPEYLIKAVSDLTGELKNFGEIESVGLAIPGLVNRETDRVLVSTGLPFTAREHIHSELMEATGLRFELENDANAAAYGEYKAGAGRDARDIFYIGIGDAIGGAIILDGKLWTGASGCAGEIGHITIDTEGAECVCGNTGCLETIASGPNIVRRARERLNRDSTSSLSRLAMQDSFTAADLALEANNGDDFSIMMLERTGRSIGIAVASMINLLSIERIVLGGPVMEAGELLLKPIVSEARKRSFQQCFEATEIVAAELGPEGIAIGAALLARDA